jgi:RNA polymerase sigma-70 factor, ECF subfamily
MDLVEAIEKLKKKDNEAFEYIYNYTKSSVYGIIINIVKSRDVTEDLMQDTYIQVVKSINSYNSDYKFSSWVIMIARNKAIDYYRKKRKEMLIDITESEYLFPNVKVMLQMS